jgi:hypothetical protein
MASFSCAAVSGGMHVAAQARNCFSDVKASEDTEEEESAHNGAVLTVLFRGGKCCPWDGRRHWTWVVSDLAVQLVEARQQIADVRSLVQQKSLLFPVMNNCHSKHSPWAAKVFDIKGCCKGSLELASPLWVTVEDQHIVQIDGNIDHEGWGDERIAGAVTFELV